VLDVDHPDIEHVHQLEGRGGEEGPALIAAGYSSDFNGEAYADRLRPELEQLGAVTARLHPGRRKDGDWNLTWRTDRQGEDGQGARAVAADREAAWACADPGVQFDTTINDWHTCPADGPINASNPCSEYMFLDNTACNLASLNLVTFYDDETGDFDIDGYLHAIRMWTIVLEISRAHGQFPSEGDRRRVVRLPHARPRLRQPRLAADAMGLPYDSDEGRTIAGALTAIMTGEPTRHRPRWPASSAPFPGYAPNREHMLRVMRNHRRAAYDAPARRVRRPRTS
jgi:ribonucleoside-diphosphate reductase alpha chain